jgi:hypothetical protein
MNSKIFWIADLLESIHRDL